MAPEENGSWHSSLGLSDFKTCALKCYVLEQREDRGLSFPVQASCTPTPWNLFLTGTSVQELALFTLVPIAVYICQSQRCRIHGCLAAPCPSGYLFMSITDLEQKESGCLVSCGSRATHTGHRALATHPQRDGRAPSSVLW